MLISSMKNKQGGFTLIELMFTIVIVGVLLALSGPNLRDFMRNSRITSSANDLLGDLHVARTEAIKRRQTVTLCASSNANASDLTTLACKAPAATDFGGWFIFVDENSDGTHDASEDVIKQHAGSPEGVTAKSNGGFVAYGNNGFVRTLGGNASASRIAFCDSRGNVRIGSDRSATRIVNLIPTGRAGVARDYSEVTTLLADVGTCP